MSQKLQKKTRFLLAVRICCVPDNFTYYRSHPQRGSQNRMFTKYSPGGKNVNYRPEVPQASISFHMESMLMKDNIYKHGARFDRYPNIFGKINRYMKHMQISWT